MDVVPDLPLPELEFPGQKLSTRGRSLVENLGGPELHMWFCLNGHGELGPESQIWFRIDGHGWLGPEWRIWFWPALAGWALSGTDASV